MNGQRRSWTLKDCEKRRGENGDSESRNTVF